MKSGGSFRFILGAAAGLGLLWCGSCSPSPFQPKSIGGEYLNYPHAIRLILDEKKRSLLMVKGMEVLSSGSYYVKWEQLYCYRDNRRIIIGQVADGRIVTEMGDFVKQN